MVAERRYRPPPVGPFPVGAPLDLGDLGTVLPQPRTTSAFDDFLLHDKSSISLRKLHDKLENSLTELGWSVQMANSLVAPSGLADRSGSIPPGRIVRYATTHMKRPQLSSRFPSHRFLFFSALIASLTFAAARRRAARKGPARRTTPARRTVAVRRLARVPARQCATLPSVFRGSRVPNEPIVRGGPWTEPTYADSTAGRLHRRRRPRSERPPSTLWALQRLGRGCRSQ